MCQKEERKKKKISKRGDFYFYYSPLIITSAESAHVVPMTREALYPLTVMDLIVCCVFFFFSFWNFCVCLSGSCMSALFCFHWIYFYFQCHRLVFVKKKKRGEVFEKF